MKRKTRLIPLTSDVIDEIGRIIGPQLDARAEQDYTPEQERAELDRLRADGIDIGTIGDLCPVQAEGRIDGRWFYFRARHAHWSIGIAPEGGTLDDAIEARWQTALSGSWSYAEPYGPPVGEAAGWMTHREALGFIEQAVRRFRQEGGKA